jgi:hypothetical protein
MLTPREVDPVFGSDVFNRLTSNECHCTAVQRKVPVTRAVSVTDDARFD